jgi:hypothetical protein
MTELKQVYAIDGKFFDTKKEAQDYLRLPKITASLMKVTNNNKELTEWLVAHQEAVEAAFDTGTIRRVTKSEQKKLDKALEALKEVGDSRLAFLVENAEAISDSFRWPSVKRMDDAEKAVAAKNSLVAIAEREDVADWILANKDAVLAAYEAGVEKRVVSPKATEALAAYRAKMAAEKAANPAA